jgi:hypothetical protein
VDYLRAEVLTGYDDDTRDFLRRTLELAGTLVWSGVPSCIASGRPDRLGGWLEDLDDRQLASLQTGDPDLMTRWLLVAYRKLGATSRDDAVSRALALGLVEAPPHV